MTTPTTAPDASDDADASDRNPNGATNAGHSSIRGAIEWVIVIAGAIAIALIVKTFLVQAFWIPSESMESTLVENDRVLVNKLSYRLHDVNRGDVIVFERPGAIAPTEIKDLIKRVVGLPGDSIVIDDDRSVVIINGVPLAEPYLDAGTVTVNGSLSCTEVKPCVVPDGNVFVMGDNRTNSKDSRYIGTVAEEHIVGRAFVRVWPLSRLGGL